MLYEFGCSSLVMNPAIKYPIPVTTVKHSTPMMTNLSRFNFEKILQIFPCLRSMSLCELTGMGDNMPKQYCKLYVISHYLIYLEHIQFTFKQTR